MSFELLIAPRRGEPIVGQEGEMTLRLAEYLEQNAEIVNQRRTIEVEIGDWNMNTTASVDVLHGLTNTNIRSVSVMIVDDAGTITYPLASLDGGAAGVMQGGVLFNNSTIVRLGRTIGGIFDSTNFQTTSFNRGWVTITYIN